MATSRRTFIMALLAQAFAIPLTVTRSGQAAIDTDNLDELELTLKTALRARRPEDVAFIAKAVALVRNGTLPRELVEAAFVWVQKKKYKERYPAIWFERSLRALATRQGIAIP